jgi:hypothetical protein
MNNFVIVTSKAEYRVCEVEFYFNDGDKHQDTFTHGDPVQKNAATWYLHRMNPQAPMSFKAGTYKGMDITFGGEGQLGGMLIRAIRDVKSGTYIDGPCNSVG